MQTKTELYKQTYNEDDAPGWDAINARTKELYGDQEPVHWATVIPYELGGPDPLRGIDCFKSGQQQPHFHYISLGFTNLFYGEEFAEDKYNGFGFELTFRHFPLEEDPEQPVWAAGLLQNMAKYVFSTKNIFDDFHYISANGPIRLNTETEITAMVFYKDPELGDLNTPHGYLKFLQIFGITTQEYQEILDKRITVEALLEKHRKVNPLLITDLNRK